MPEGSKPRGRPRKHAEFEALLASLPRPMTKRPHYLHGIGIFRGSRSDTAWIKIRLPHGGSYKGRHYQPGASLEIKVGNLASFSWEDLLQKHREYQGKADRGEALEPVAKRTFADQADDWLSRAQHRLRSHSLVRIHIEQHLKPRFGQMILDSISVAHVNAWVAEMLRTQRPATVKRELDTMKAVLNDAVRSGLLERNPCDHADPIRGIVGRQRFLQPDEMVRVLAAAADVADCLPDFLLWCIHSGMRKSEVLALTWSDVVSLQDGRKLVAIRQSKTDQPRLVHCTRTMVEVLERQALSRKNGDDRIFGLTAMSLRRKWERLRKAVQLNDITIHDLRRTHGTHAAAAGVDLRTLADRIGHNDLTMLQRHYAAVVGSAASEAADTFQKAFDQMIAGASRGR